MSRTDNSTRFDGLHNHGADGTQPLVSGVLSQDFPKRLERLEGGQRPQLARLRQGPRR